ncbi:MAG: alpha/beta hydrolase [Bauldia sp.]|nr:alpha/beta hydrolase [Bauldia sp.]
MNDTSVETLTIGDELETRTIAVLRRPGGSPGLLWLGGYRSDMRGTKAEAVDRYAEANGLAFTRLDYSGHGASGGDFAEGTISRWLAEAEAVFATTTGPQIVIGSSMGGWLALLLAAAERRRGSRRVAGLVLIAPAVDMTKVLMWDAMSRAVRKTLRDVGIYHTANAYGGEPMPITWRLVEDGEKHLFGDSLIEPGCPVHILQGMEDKEVPWRIAAGLVERIASDDAVLTLIKDGDHRLSRPEDLDRLTATIASLIAATKDDKHGED